MEAVWFSAIDANRKTELASVLANLHICELLLLRSARVIVELSKQHSASIDELIDVITKDFALA